MLNKQKILVIGAGAWGTAIANLIAVNSYQTLLKTNDQALTKQINQTLINPKLSADLKLDQNIKAIDNIDCAANFVFIVVPSNKVQSLFVELKNYKFLPKTIFVICSKGIEENSLKLLGDLFEENFNYPVAILSGPNFATEVAMGYPTVTTVASRKKSISGAVCKLLNNQFFLAKPSKNIRTAEICGLFKNIMAIGCGMAEELGMGVNSKSALIMRGIEEIKILCKYFNASTKIDDAAGFGDIFLTCSSANSRNNKLGRMIAKGEKIDQNITFEGLTAAISISKISQKAKLGLDLCSAINKIIKEEICDQNQLKNMITSAILKN